MVTTSKALLRRLSQIMRLAVSLLFLDKEMLLILRVNQHSSDHV